MKLTFTILLFIFITVITTSDISARPKVKAKITDNTVASLVEGLNSENIGLRSSSAYMIGELQLSSAVIPLLRILHRDENEEMRIAAALALYKIGSPIAIHAVKQSIRFDDSERVKNIFFISSPESGIVIPAFLF
ncbi:MAG: HEAT repeat domain-containing protein [Ignavibacteriaceae bacterium]|nr:HEAT repeat domain-containing protein [Ignavibacteriaceae bacterium]